MHFASIGSGSTGNGTIIKSEQSLILLDCGFTCKETVRRLALLDVSPEDISAILVTHEHNDHISGVGVFSRKYQTPVYMNYGTYCQKDLGKYSQLFLFNSFQSFTINDLHISPLVVPHDAREAVQFIFQLKHKRLAVLTDLGYISPYLYGELTNIHSLLIEANHDKTMLANGSYAPSLKKRVSGKYGHLENTQAVQLIQSIDLNQCQHLVAAHLSQENNSIEKVTKAFAPSLQALSNNIKLEIDLAGQESGFEWKYIQ
ncbi:MAG: MBL fold metallo-hydrolase [Gammaproteobacteria bacterium]|nr:MBL fold metallo-hydrolase [Gammaproteobacteria bacterium]